MRAVFVALWPALLLVACGGQDGAHKLRIYTSIYPHVLERMEPVLEAEFPDAEIVWVQKGSEQIASVLEFELATGATRCDLLMTSDPFYYAELKERGLLLAYESPAARAVPAALRDPDHTFVTVRLPVMVLGVNTGAVPEAERPRSFADLALPRFRDLVSMGDPSESGTSFTTVALLARGGDWRLLESWIANGLVSAGGNSNVIGRLESRERPVGVVLLENLLPEIEDGVPLAAVFPEDGAVPVPSPIAILSSTEQAELARKVYDFMFSPAIQEAIVEGYMYSPLPQHRPPTGAPPWEELELQPWNPELLLEVKARRQEIKDHFRALLRR